MAERRTKIVCTIGPAVDSAKAIKSLIRAGMNVARLNCSHGDWEQKRRWIEWIRQLSPKVGPVGIMADLQGPKFRMGVLPDGGRKLKNGQLVSLGPDDACDIPIFEEVVLGALAKGDQILLGDGQVQLKVTSCQSHSFTARVENGGIAKSRQGVTVIDRSFDVPAITAKDLEDIRQAAQAGVDFIALSYVRCPEDMEQLRAEVAKYNPEIQILAKLETPEGVKNLGPILRACDGLMVARGDLGLQMPLEEVPMVQKSAIRFAGLHGKPVITATQMLESMMSSPRPTRAEAGDVANAVLDGTDALMLSGETAAGDYPIESVKWMAKIATRTEKARHINVRLTEFARDRTKAPHTEAVAFAVAHLAAMLDPKAILTTTTSGQTARLVSRFRPEAPIFCVAWKESVLRQLSLCWGVKAVQVEKEIDTDKLVDATLAAFVERGMLAKGDLAIITAGVPGGTPGQTNLVLTRRVD